MNVPESCVPQVLPLAALVALVVSRYRLAQSAPVKPTGSVLFRVVDSSLDVG